MTPVSFGEFLKRLRKRAGMTQAELAAATGYSRSLIAALESGGRSPDVKMVEQSFLAVLGLGGEPHLAEQLVRLAAEARGERPPAALTPEGSRALRSAISPSCWPAQPTEILGREGEIADVSARLLDGRSRLLTLVGPPGVGKTRLALAVGERCQSFYRDAACFATLAGVVDPTLVASTLVTSLGLQEGAGTPGRRLVEHLRRKEMLLVLDNFEQLLGPASPAVTLVGDLLAACPGLTILVTSRERLHLRAERRYPVPPLSLAVAAALFAERAAAIDATFALTPSNLALVEAICEAVDRMPLAVELCAGQIDLLALPQLLAHLRNRRLDVLVDGARDHAAGHVTLREAIGNSYELLLEDERVLLRGLGVFLGGCSLDEIGRVCPEAGLPALHSLIGKSLVRAQPAPDDGMRYLLLETIRDYALEQARAAGEETALRERHFVAYLALFRTADRALRGPQVATWLARVEPEQDNLRGALRWALDAGRYEDAATLLVLAWQYWHHIGRWHEMTQWLAQLLPHREALPPCLRVAVLIQLHGAARGGAQFRELGPYTTEMLALLEQCPDPLLHARAWHFVANTILDLPGVAAAYERAIACARSAPPDMDHQAQYGASGDRDMALGSPLYWYATRLVEYGEFDRATPLLAECTRLFEARGARYRLADTLGTAGRLALLRGDLAASYALLSEAVGLACTYNHQEMVGRLQPLLGLVALYRGDAAEARRLLGASLALCMELNDAYFMARVCTGLSEVHLAAGELAEAKARLIESFAYHATSRWSKIFPVERLLLAARLAAACGAYERAATLFGAAARARQETQYQPAGIMRELADSARATAAAALGPVAFDRARADGEQLSLAGAFAAAAGS